MSRNAADVRWVKVWDPLVRVFHWSTVTLFVCAYYSAEWGHNEDHLLFGYTLSVILLVRLIWGLIGTHHARFRNFWYSPRHVLGYAASLKHGAPDHYLGHNPLGAMMVFSLLTMLVLMSVTGLLLAAGLEFEGPLLALTGMLSDDTVYQILAIHRFVVYLLLGCVLLHVLGVVLSSRLHHENLVFAMLSGKKPVPPESTKQSHTKQSHKG